MDYVTVPYARYWKQSLSLLSKRGLLLVTAGKDGRPNAMTIGWATLGVIWGKKIMTVLVRPSRHTYGLLNATGSFTVCVPPKSHYPAVDFCGAQSGRDYDKFAQCGLAPLPSTMVSAPAIDGSVVIYECRVVHTNDVMPGNLAPDILAGSYPKGDFHRVYFGEILAVRALPDAGRRLAR